MMFEDLDAWQQARHLVNEIYSLTRENSSLSKDFGLTDQVQRAAVSIMSNIAEAFERTLSPRKFSSTTLRVGSQRSEVRLAALREFPTITHDAAPVAERLTRHRNLNREARSHGLLRDRSARRKGRLPRTLSLLLAPISYLLASIFR